MTANAVFSSAAFVKLTGRTVDFITIERQL
jgi:hypothetical protein